MLRRPAVGRSLIPMRTKSRHLIAVLAAAAAGFASLPAASTAQGLSGRGYNESAEGARQALGDLLGQLRDAENEGAALLEALRSDDFGERERATQALIPMAYALAHKLEQIQKEGDADARVRATIALQRGGDRTYRPEEFLRDAAALIAARSFAGLAGPLLEAIDACPVESPDIWDACERALKETASGDDVALLRAALESAQPAARAAATTALAEVDPDNAKPFLAPLLADKHPRVSLAAAAYFAERGDKLCLPALINALESDEHNVRWRSVYYLRRLTGEHFDFKSGDPDEVRAKSVRRWHQWLKENGPTAELKADPKDAKAGIPLIEEGDLAAWEEVPVIGRAGDLQEDGDPNKLEEGAGAFSFKDGVLECNGKRKSILRSRAAFADFRLRLEFRGAAGLFTDSGIGLFLNEETGAFFEIDLHAEHAGDLIRIGGDLPATDLDGNPLAHRAAANPRAKLKDGDDEWNTLEASISGGELEVMINGETVNRVKGLPTGPHQILLRNEGTWFEFRNILINPTN